MVAVAVLAVAVGVAVALVAVATALVVVMDAGWSSSTYDSTGRPIITDFRELPTNRPKSG